MNRYHDGWLAGNIQLYGAGLNTALSDRLCIGLNQGGYAVSHFGGRASVPSDPSLADRDMGGSRDGWLNLGEFIQYTLVEAVP